MLKTKPKIDWSDPDERRRYYREKAARYRRARGARIRATLEELTGRRFGRLTVVGRAPKRWKSNARFWLCRCDCGREIVYPTNELVSGLKVSCGCYRDEIRGKNLITHGMTGSSAYNRWSGMIARCHNPSNPSFGRYGGRGIRVCRRWRSSFQAFFADMGEPPTPRHKLERINNSRGYEPGNCRWATSVEQAQNTRRNRRVTVGSKTLCIAEWARRGSMTVQTIYQRLYRGWPIDRAVSEPPH